MYLMLVKHGYRFFNTCKKYHIADFSFLALYNLLIFEIFIKFFEKHFDLFYFDE
jgi:hypothetical protein